MKCEQEMPIADDNRSLFVVFVLFFRKFLNFEHVPCYHNWELYCKCVWARCHLNAIVLLLLLLFISVCQFMVVIVIVILWLLFAG